MERSGGAGGGAHHTHYQQQQQQQQYQQYQQHAAAYMTAADEHTSTGKSSFDNPATRKKPPKLKTISRSISMAIDNYRPGDGGMSGSPPQMMLDDSLIVEQPLIHRAASPLALRSAAPPQTLALPTHHQQQLHLQHQQQHGGSGSVSPALSARQQHHQQQQQQQQHMHSFRHQQQQQHQHSSSASSPTAHTVSPIPSGGGSSSSQAYQQDIYLLNSRSLGDDMGAVGGGGGSTSPIQFIDDYMLPPSTHRHGGAASATHPLKKSMFRRSDTIDVHPSSAQFQMKKTHSFHTQQDSGGILDQQHQQLLLSAAAAGGTSAISSRRTSSVRGNFLMPGHPSGTTKDISRSPSPSRRGCRSHRSFNDPARRPSHKPESVVDSQIRHPSLNDELMESLEGRAGLFAQTNLSLENELFLESRSRSNSHTKMEDVGADIAAAQRAAAVMLLRKSSGSFEDAAGAISATHPPASATSFKKRAAAAAEHHRQHSSHSLELDGRPSTSAAAAAAAAAVAAHGGHPLQLHSAAAAATAAYHFKRGAQHGRSLYLSPNNLEELQVHRPAVLSAAAAFQGTNTSAAKQAKAMHSASMRLRTYRENLSATKKSKSFIGDSAYPPPSTMGGNEFELTSPHRRNSRPLSSAAVASGGAISIEDIKRSPRPMALASTSSAAAAAFIEEKRPSFERKGSLTYELSDAAFEQVLRPFHHKVSTTAGRKASISGSHSKALKKKSLSDETDDAAEIERKRKRMAFIVMIVFVCLACAAGLVVLLTLPHSSGQSHPPPQHHPGAGKKIPQFTRDTPVHYNVRQENERLMKETMERARYGKNFTEAASLISTPAQLGGTAAAHAQQIP